MPPEPGSRALLARARHEPGKWRPGPVIGLLLRGVCRWWPGATAATAAAAAISFYSACSEVQGLQLLVHVLLRRHTARRPPPGRRASGGRVWTRRAHPRCPPSPDADGACASTSSPHRHVPAQGYPRLGRADGRGGELASRATHEPSPRHATPRQ